MSGLPECTPSPVEELRAPEFEAAGLRLFVKRDDLLAWAPGSALCGNKWRKLKYNLIAAREQGLNHLITFGGAYSNHLAAVAEAAHVLGFTSTGIVRGEETLPLNPTLRFARDCGMALRYVSRQAYRNKPEADFLPVLGINPDGAYVIPEGGTNSLALPGCRELAKEIFQQSDPDYIAVAYGTGGTLAGIASGLEGRCTALGVSVLRGGASDAIASNGQERGWSDGIATPARSDGIAVVLTGYHHGGYAKWTPELIAFIRRFKSEHGIALDPVYTGKLFYALSDLTAKGYFPRGSTVLVVHTGGLQGVAGFEERFGVLLH